MVASRQVEIPFFRRIGWQRGRGFGALAQVNGRTAIHFLRKIIVPDVNGAGVDLLEIAMPEVADIVSDRKNFKTAADNMGRQTLRRQLGSGSRKKTTSRIIPTKSVRQSSRSRTDNFTNFWIILLANVRYQHFVAVSGNFGGKVPVVVDVLSSHERELCPSTSFEESCIEFEFQVDRKRYVDLRQTYLALKLKFVTCRSYEINYSRELKKED